ERSDCCPSDAPIIPWSLAAGRGEDLRLGASSDRGTGGGIVDWQMKILIAEAERLLELAAEDADLRADLRALAEKILMVTAASPADADDDAEDSRSTAVSASAVEEER